MTIDNLFWACGNLNDETFIIIWDDEEDYREFSSPMMGKRFYSLPLFIQQKEFREFRINTETNTIHILL